jgi:hypothetical protein
MESPTGRVYPPACKPSPYGLEADPEGGFSILSFRIPDQVEDMLDAESSYFFAWIPASAGMTTNA